MRRVEIAPGVTIKVEDDADDEAVRAQFGARRVQTKIKTPDEAQTKTPAKKAAAKKS